MKSKKHKYLDRGTSLLELLVAVTLAALLAAIGAPHLPKMERSFDRMNARANLLQDIKRSQAQAITEGCRGILKIAPDRRSYSYGCDYLSYDTNNPPSPDHVAFVRRLPKDIIIQSSQPVIFNSRGQTVDADYIISNATVKLLDAVNGQTLASGTLLGTGVFSYE